MELIRPCLDLTVSAWVRRLGDLRVYGTWRYDADETAWVPCMVLLPMFVQEHHRLVPCVVTMDLAWIWSEEYGDPLYADEVAYSFCVSLGWPPDTKHKNRILSVIRDHMDDLVGIGVRPRDREEVVADAIVTSHQSGKRRHVEVRDDV